MPISHTGCVERSKTKSTFKFQELIKSPGFFFGWVCSGFVATPPCLLASVLAVSKPPRGFYATERGAWVHWELFQSRDIGARKPAQAAEIGRMAATGQWPAA